MLIKEQIASKTPIGTSMKPYVTRQSMGKFSHYEFVSNGLI